MNMKMNNFMCAVIFVTFTSEAFADPEAKVYELFKKIMLSGEKCANSSGFTEKKAKVFFQTMNSVPRNVGCFVSCMGKELDLVNDKNLFDKEKYFKLLDMLQAEERVAKEEKNKKIIETCIDAQKEDPDPCVVGKNVAQCVISDSIKAGFKI